MPTRRSITQLKAAWQQARDNIIPTIVRILTEHERDILELNWSQLYSGYDGYGRQLQEYRDAGYAAMKHEMNPQPGFGTPDLYLTGSTYEKMRAVINSQTLGIDSKDEKSAALQSKYGEGIFKLSSDSINILRREVIQPNLVYEIAEQTGAEIG